jgi:hypothetical protein
MLLGWVVLEINFREPALTLRQYFVLINLIIFTVLKQYHVKIVIHYLADGDIMYIVPPNEARRAPAVAFALSFRQVKFEWSLGKVIKIISVNMPGKNPEFSFYYGLALPLCIIAFVAKMAASGVFTASPATIQC